MARSSMADLIDRLRTAVGDTGTTHVFDDDDLEGFLDGRSQDVVEAALLVRPSFGSGNTTIYVDYFHGLAPGAFWEDDVVLHDVGGTVLTPDDADLVRGHWTFTDGQQAPVYITGRWFDFNGSASAVAEAWAAKAAAEFDFMSDGQSFSRSQKHRGLIAVAREYARRAIQPGRRPAWRSTDW